jgi:hypothetical protein
MATEPSNKLKFLLASKVIDFANDTCKIILMANGYTFNKDTAHGYANVSANELANGYGYTVGGASLANATVTEDDTDDRCRVTWNNVNWTANGGNIGPTPGAIIYDDTVTTPTADPVVGYIDFGGNQTQASGGVLTIANVEVRIS